MPLPWRISSTRKASDAGALAVLNQQVKQQATNPEIYLLLGELYEKSGQPAKARKVYQQALADQNLPAAAKTRFGDKLQALSARSEKR